jgi:bifunctional UDP-N-acetylglucosamine pyrophosphorylase/glucosamine-1-phosphate N-acetyltransferase
MRSSRPKVLHELAGRPLLEWVLETARSLGPDEIRVVTGVGGGEIRSRFGESGIRFVDQPEPLGTAHALGLAVVDVTGDPSVLVLYGDVPLLEADDCKRLLEAVEQPALTLLTMERMDPCGYGRIIRDEHGQVRRVVEEADLSDDTMRAIREVNTGILACSGQLLTRLLPRIGKRNAQGEFYLTDLVEEAFRDGVPVHTRLLRCPEKAQGVNSASDLATAERILQTRLAGALMRQGVRIRDPARFDLRGSVEAASDVELDVGVILEGRIRLGPGVRIGPYSILRDVSLGEGTEVLSHCVLEGVETGNHVRIGPFARIRSSTRLHHHVRIGNFVEVKNSRLGESSKANHLAYIGDAEIGDDVNLGAGVITVNYDGAEKHVTVIEDGVFVGCDSQLIAPVRLGHGSFIAAGTTVVRDTPPDQLTLSRNDQKNIPHWKRPGKKS